MRLWLGGYTSDMNGNAAGIGVLHAGAPDEPSAAGALTFAGTAVAASSPSWLTAHPTLDVVYAALEGEGAVGAFERIGPDAFATLGPSRQTGAEACHVAVSPDGGWLTACSYGTGAVARVPLNAAGELGEPTFGVAAVDPYGISGVAGVELFGGSAAVEAAQAGERTSRAHQAVSLPGGLVATSDLGFDLVRFWRDGVLLQETTLPFGCGPRGLLWHPSGHLYVLTEYSCEVFALAPDPSGIWRIVTAAPASPEASADGDFGAELTMTADGAHLYAGIRGIDAIGVLRVRDGGTRVESVATVDSQVGWPRHHALVGSTLLIAGQQSDEVASLSVDERSQIPGKRRSAAHVPSPTVILPAFD